MAAFLEGRLERSEVEEVARHLQGCEQCRTVVAETARFEREEAARQPARIVPMRRPRVWAVAAAALIAISVPASLLTQRARDPMARLVRAAPAQHRVIESRLSEFPWARLRPPSRGEVPPDPADLKFGGTAGEVLEKTAGDGSAKALHAAGVAQLLIGRRNDGIAALERAAKDSKDARVWNDLAAARYAVAVEGSEPSQLPSALAAADRALALDPRFAPALFNRALILERLQLRDEARRAWERYLEADPGSGWSTEARERLRRLTNPSEVFDAKELARTANLRGYVAKFPEETRRWTEGVFLADWVDTEAAKDPQAAAKLTFVRSTAATPLAGSRCAKPQQAVRTRWSARRRGPLGSGPPPRPHIRRAEPGRWWEP